MVGDVVGSWLGACSIIPPTTFAFPTPISPAPQSHLHQPRTLPVASSSNRTDGRRVLILPFFDLRSHGEHAATAGTTMTLNATFTRCQR